MQQKQGVPKKITDREEKVTRDVALSKQARESTQNGKTGGGGPSKKQSKSPVSVRKVETIRKLSAGDIQGYRLLDITILKDILMGLSCPEFFEVGSLIS